MTLPSSWLPRADGVSSGALSALGGVCSKLALSPDSAAVHAVATWCSNAGAPPQAVAAASLATRGLLLLAMVVINSLAMAQFIAAMRRAGTTSGTVVTTGANFLATAVAGWLVFSEPINTRWCVGAATIVLGIALMSLPVPAATVHSNGATITTSAAAAAEAPAPHSSAPRSRRRQRATSLSRSRTPRGGAASRARRTATPVN